MTATTRVDPIFEPLDASKTFFELLGGESAIGALVRRFYDLMDVEPGFAALRAAHGPSLDNAREKLFLFLCGYFGGPNYYIERYGHPRLRARHLPFSIGVAERDQWVACMNRAMCEEGVPAPLLARIAFAFQGVADWMRNRVE